MDEEISTSIDYMNYMFAIAFTFEVIIKMTALGLRGYFAIGWNRFDCFVVIVTNFGMVLDWFFDVQVCAFRRLDVGSF